MHDEHRYKIGEVSRMYGLPNDTLRYYESRGIITPRRSEESGYRYYDAWELNYLLDCVWYRSYDFSLSDVEQMVNKDDLPAFLARCRKRETELIRAVVTYLVAYVLMLLVSSCIATLLGLNITDAFTATMTSLSNVGPAMGSQLGPSANFADISGALHLLFAFDMIVGRLEIVPVLLCLTRFFWRL